MNNKYTNSQIPFDERPINKILKYGGNVLTNSELLSLLIGAEYKEYSAITLAQKIIYDNKKGLLNIACADKHYLSELKGLNKCKIAKILALSELSKRISKERVNKTKISSPQTISALLQEEMRYLKIEIFKIILLDTKNNIISINNISIGCLDSTIVHPREVFVSAIKESAASIILVHNHPSGETEPSKDDINITNRLIETGKIIGIKVLDHIIIGNGNYLSFKEQGYMYS